MAALWTEEILLYPDVQYSSARVHVYTYITAHITTFFVVLIRLFIPVQSEENIPPDGVLY